jgi:uncharacterized membrane protein
MGRLLLLAVLPPALATLIGLVVLWPDEGRPARSEALGPPLDLEDATVTRVTPRPCGTAEAPVPGSCALAEIRLDSGPDRGGVTTLELTEGPGQPDLSVGSRIVVGRSSDPALGNIYYFSDFQRRVPLIWLAVLFAAVVVAVGRVRGLAALAGLAVSFALLVQFVLPAILEGRSPLVVAIVGSSAMMFVLLYLAHGVTAMTTTALLGTLASLALTGLLAGLFVEVADLVNLGSEESTFLQFSAAQVNLQGLLLGGIIIGSLGVLNDVTVTQASAVWQLRAANPRARARRLYTQAMRIGRDHIASAVDTLVLAYAGASLPLLLLFTLADRPVGDVLTGSLVAEELVRTMVGSIGLAASVPITTGLAAFVAARTLPPASGPESGGRPPGD